MSISSNLPNAIAIRSTASCRRVFKVAPNLSHESRPMKKGGVEATL